MKSIDFNNLGLSEKLLQTINEMGFSQMTPIQAASIPLLLAGKDFIGQSKTGSGKTAAFVIPILQKIDIQRAQPQALILCPTRELCDQVLNECRKFSKGMMGLQTVALVGGQPYPPQTQALDKGVHLIVGTPGRTLEHLKGDQIQVEQLRTLVLDEADRMLEEGFAEEMTAIIEKLPHRRQTVFFSATFPESIEKLSRQYQKNVQKVTIQDSPNSNSSIEQYVYEAENPEKIQTLVQILQNFPSMCTLIFCRTKNTVNELGQLLTQSKVSCDILHGDLEQTERDRVTSLFRSGSIRILVATDVAARGLDIKSLELVINVDLPSSPEIYIHRIGRTGRAGRKGVAVSIATAYEASKVEEIEKLTGVPMIRQPLKTNNPIGLGQEFQKTLMKTLQISGGRLNKLRPGDILGALTAEPQPIATADIGKIDIQDRYSHVAISPDKIERAIEKLRHQKIKGLKFKIYLV